MKEYHTSTLKCLELSSNSTQAYHKAICFCLSAQLHCVLAVALNTFRFASSLKVFHFTCKACSVLCLNCLSIQTAWHASMPSVRLSSTQPAPQGVDAVTLARHLGMLELKLLHSSSPKYFHASSKYFHSGELINLT
jgi:hypothetical protein